MNEKNSAQLVYQSNEIVLTNTEAKLSPLPKEYNFNADENDIKDSWITGPYYEFPTVKTETNGNKYYSTKGNSRVESVKAIPINPNFNYSLSGDFKVTGNETSTSLVYLALMPMTNDYSRIYKYEHLKFGTHATLSNYDENSKTITVTNASDLSG